MLRCLLAGAVILGVVGWVVWPGQGLGVEWKAAPGRPLRFRYLTSGTFWRHEEAWRHEFGLTYRDDPFLVMLAQRLEAK